MVRKCKIISIRFPIPSDKPTLSCLIAIKARICIVLTFDDQSIEKRTVSASHWATKSWTRTLCEPIISRFSSPERSESLGPFNRWRAVGSSRDWLKIAPGFTMNY